MPRIKGVRVEENQMKNVGYVNNNKYAKYIYTVKTFYKIFFEISQQNLNFISVPNIRKTNNLVDFVPL